MKYRGFVLEPEYNCCAHFRLFEDGRVVDRKPTSKDIEWWNILDPMENMNRHEAEFDVHDCKKVIDSLLFKMGMESNLPKEWAKLEGVPTCT